MDKDRKNSDFPDEESMERYIQGKMSPEEAYQFERRVLRDPFYNEALEGLESIDPDDASQDIRELSQRLKNRIVTRERSRTWYYSAAAAVIILAVSSYFIYISTSGIDEVAQEGIVSLNQEEDFSFPAEETEPESKADRDERLIDEEVPRIPPPEITGQEPSEPERQGPERKENEGEGIPRRNMHEEKEAYPNGTADDTGLAEAIEPAKTFPGIDDLAEQDESIEAVADVAEIEDEESVNEQQDRREEFPPQGRSPEKPLKSVAEAPVSRISATEKGIVSAEMYPTEPLMGWENYAEYIDKNLQYPEQALRNQIEGTVMLSFIINKDSLPDQIKVIQSVSDACDREAIRLLKEGPKWLPVRIEGEPRAQYMQYSITFNLEE